MKCRIVVLAHAHDLGASAVAARLSTCLGSQDVTVVRPEALGLARWSHRLGSTSEVQTDLRLPSGTEIASAGVTCLFNRLQYLPSPRFHGATPKDQAYASAELQALVASWLHGLDARAVNPAGPRGLPQGPVSRRGWLALAAGCQLPVARSTAATSGRIVRATMPGDRVRLRAPWPGGVRGPAPVEVEQDPETRAEEEVLLVAGERIVGPLTGRFGERCQEVAQRSGCTLLEFRFRRIEREFAVVDVDPLPALSRTWAVAATVELLLDTATRCDEKR